MNTRNARLRIERLWPIVAVLTFVACSSTKPISEPPPTTAREDSEYAVLYPYYAEICALSQIVKKPGFGVELSGGIGGHEVLYLNGVCRKPGESYPSLMLCDDVLPKPPTDGVGVTVNAHYKNASWVAIEGRNFFFYGDLKPGETLTRDAYAGVQARAQAKNLYDGIVFHDSYFEEMPSGFTRSTFRYEVSVSTDYAIAFGRNRYCARVPMNQAQMRKSIDYLNAQNEPYKAGKKIFEWNILTHNCAHINHNALAAADIWFLWPMDRTVLISMFDFPVPKNEFVNLMLRTNDLPIDNPAALYRDTSARTLLLSEGRLPTGPGAIADLGTIIRPNEVYEPQSNIIFYDEPITGSFQRRFDAILTQPRYFRLRDNLEYFSQLYKKIQNDREPVEKYLVTHHENLNERASDFRNFYQRYYDYIDSETAEVARKLAMLDSNSR